MINQQRFKAVAGSGAHRRPPDKGRNLWLLCGRLTTHGAARWRRCQATSRARVQRVDEGQACAVCTRLQCKGHTPDDKGTHARTYTQRAAHTTRPACRHHRRCAHTSANSRHDACIERSKEPSIGQQCEDRRPLIHRHDVIQSQDLARAMVTRCCLLRSLPMTSHSQKTWLV